MPHEDQPYAKLQVGGKVFGRSQAAAVAVIVTGVLGSLAWSVEASGYDTSEYNWVDNGRVGVPRAMGLLLVVLYGQATLYNHCSFVDYALFAKPVADPDSKESAEERWAQTPTVARGAAVSAGGWAVCYGLTIFCMTIFEPGCQRGLCITVMLCLGVWWQICWYGAMLGRIDIDDERKVPAKNWFLAETIQEIVISSICGFLVFFAKGAAFSPVPPGTSMDSVRTWFVRFVGSLLIILYGAATLCNHHMFVRDFAKPLLIEGSNVEDIWRTTPTASKHIAVQSGGWCVCFALTIVAMTFLEPGCERGLCKCWALAMLWWNCVWYAGMFNRVDFNDHCKRPWTNWFKTESIQEFVLFTISGYLGFIAE